MALQVFINRDTQDLPLGTSGVDWVLMNVTTDYLVFSNGSVSIADGQPLPSPAELTQAGVLITTTDVEVPKFFLADISEGILKEIKNAGNQNKRYVFAFDFDAETASEPVLEVWDDATMQTINSNSLGAGVPSSSFFRGITTTLVLPGIGWTGSRLAGSSPTHFLELNGGNGALVAAGTLYCNLRITVPANFTQGFSDSNVLVVKYTGN